MSKRMSGYREVRPHVYMWQAARFHCERAESEESGSFFAAMSCIVFCAFCIEAYVNHAGAKHVDEWPATRDAEKQERWSPKEKIKALAERTKFNLDMGSKPFQAHSVLFDFRDSIAHSRTERISYDGPPLPDHHLWGNKPTTKWEDLCTPEEARRLLDDTERMVRTLHRHIVGEHDDPLMSSAHGFFGTRDN